MVTIHPVTGGTCVLRRSLLALLAIPLLALSLLAGVALAAEKKTLPSVARPHLRLAKQNLTQGLVFFLRVDSPPGVAAVGTAHAFDIKDVGETQTAEFTL